MKKLLLFIAMLCSWGSVEAVVEYEIGNINNSNRITEPLMLQFGEDIYYGTIYGATNYSSSEPTYFGLYDSERTQIIYENTGYTRQNRGIDSQKSKIIARFSYNSKTFYILSFSYRGDTAYPFPYNDNILVLVNEDLEYRIIPSSSGTAFNIFGKYVNIQGSITDLNTMASTGVITSFNTVGGYALSVVSNSTTTQIVHTDGTNFYLTQNIQLSSSSIGVSTTEIFDGDLTGGELERLSLTQQSGWSKGVFRFDDISGIRYFWLSGCLTGTGFTFETSTGSTIYSNNATWIGENENPGLSGFFPLELKYWDYAYNGTWLKTLNNDDLIDYGGECTENYGFSDFTGNIPGEIYVVKGGKLYVNVLDSEDVQLITGTGTTGGSSSGGGGGGTGIPGSIDYQDPFATCNEDPSITQFLGCIAEWISYIFGRLIAFFEAITDFINKILDLFTEEERSLTSYIFGIQQANAGGIGGMLPDRPIDYEDNFMGKFDGMIMGMLYFILVIITLVGILVMVKK